MHAQIIGVAEHHVAQGTDLNADVLLLNLLNQVREQAKLEAMSNTLSIKRHSRMDVRDLLVMSFTGVEEARHVMQFLLCAQKQRGKSVDLRRELFFVNHVEAGDQVAILFVCL